MSDFGRGQPYPDLMGRAETLLNGNFTTPEAAQLEESGAAYWRGKRYSFTEFLKRPSKEWLCERVLGVRDLGLIYGPSGEGKTYTAHDMALAFSMGRVFANSFAVVHPLSVAYCTGEGIGGLADRIRALHYHFKPKSDLPFFLYEDVPQLFDANGENGALAFLAEWQLAASEGLLPATLDVLILDTLHNSTAGSDVLCAQPVTLYSAPKRPGKSIR
jgi:hypothetical protein